MNWRCPANPRAGGAEAVTFEIARRLVQRGDSVEWFSASFPGAPAEETLDGVRIVRAGRQWTVHWSAFRHYKGKLAQRFDVVVDEVNTIPFFTPLWSDVPAVMFIFQLAREVWWYESKFPVNALGFLAEPHYLKPYRHLPAITISASTSSDLRHLGFKAPITIIPAGVEPITELPTGKTANPTFLYVGRLAPSKRVTDIVRAFAIFHRSVDSARLCLIGGGSPAYVSELRALARTLGIHENVRFAGHVSTLEKHGEMAAAHILLLASAREGWGLVVTEANAFGTPAVAYDVPGLRDSIHDRETGLLVQPSPAALASAMIRLWQDPALYQRLSVAAMAWSGTLSFEQTATDFRAAIAAAVAEPRRDQRVRRGGARSPSTRIGAP